jgi:hypothetical protein
VPADEVEPSLVDPLVVSSGHNVSEQLTLTNHGNGDISVVTTGQLFAPIVNPYTNQVVGGYAGAQLLPLVGFRVAPGASNTIPLRVGTASVVPELGYAVPAGQWAIEPRINIEGRGLFRTSQLAITIH